MKKLNNTFTPKIVANKLNLKPSTLRSYSNQFEQNGYVFQRDASNRRLYIEKDIALIHKFIELIHDNNISKKVAIELLLADHNSSATQSLEESMLLLTQQISVISNKLHHMESNYEKMHAKLTSLENVLQLSENPNELIHSIKKEIIALNDTIQELNNNHKEKNSFWTRFQR